MISYFNKKADKEIVAVQIQQERKAVEMVGDIAKERCAHAVVLA